MSNWDEIKKQMEEDLKAARDELANLSSDESNKERRNQLEIEIALLAGYLAKLNANYQGTRTGD
ncbi:MAG: hypothetical protein OXG05_06250 [Gammaproteobacteria bacterium]|nr:hypothetical protein [Gammaproteobacteria bacterium]